MTTTPDDLDDGADEDYYFRCAGCRNVLPVNDMTVWQIYDYTLSDGRKVMKVGVYCCAAHARRDGAMAWR